MARIVVVGAGIGRISQVYELKKALGMVTATTQNIANVIRGEEPSHREKAVLKMVGAMRLKESA